MGKQLVVVLLGLLFLAIVDCGIADEHDQRKGETEVIIYYIPFNHETYMPVTPDSIEEEAYCAIRISSNSTEAKSIRNMIGTATVGGFDDQFVRIKAVGLFTADVFVDKFGGVRSSSERDRKIEPGSLRALKEILDGLAESVGCNN